jgi:hypothetical protein
VTHLADGVEIRFYEADPTVPTVIRLHAVAGGWSGDRSRPASSGP